MLIIVMIVPPGPVFPLLIGVPFFELSMVAVGFDLPTLVVDNFIAIPHMVVLVTRVVDAIRSAYCTAAEYHRRKECNSQQN
jgi:hypothetical protein